MHRASSIDERMLSLPTPGEVGDDSSHVYFKDIILPASDESEDESESQHSESGDSALQAERELRRTQTRKKKMRVSRPNPILPFCSERQSSDAPVLFTVRPHGGSTSSTG